MKFLHTMVRVSNLEESLQFYTNILGLKEMRRKEVLAGEFTLIFLATAG
jgi:lactoylglutathione lyase